MANTETPQRDDKRVYDEPGNDSYLVDKSPSNDGSDPRTSFSARHHFPGGDSSDHRGGTPRNDGKAVGRDELRSREGAATSGTNNKYDTTKEEREAFNSLQSKSESLGAKFGGLYTGGAEPRTFMGRVRGFGRKKITAIVISAVIGGGGIFGLSIISGPAQAVQMAHQLMRHFKSNEDFNNDRSSKLLLSSLRKGEKERTRLGFTGNLAADKWEKRLAQNTGMKPVYQMPSGRFIGFEIVDQNKAKSIIGDIEQGEGRNNSKLQRTMGRGAAIKDVGNRQIQPTGSGRDGLNPNVQFLDLSNVGAGDRRAWINTISKSTGTNKVSSALGSRLLIKRAGVNFHPMNKVKGKLDNAREKRLIDKRNNEIKSGVEETAIAKAGTKTDEEGKSVDDAEGQKVSDEAKDALADFNAKGFAKMARPTPDALLGIMCSARQAGSAVEKYKFANNVLPMIRMGMYTVAVGSQIMSNEDISMANVALVTTFMYDSTAKSSWTQAESIRAEQGKTGGTPIAKEADLRNEGTTGKPKFFKVLDDIPALGTGCKIQEAIFGLPVISTIVGGVGAITGQITDAVLKVADTSTEEITEGALKVVAGKTVDPNSKGAAFGNLANTGAFLASNDQAIASGGKPLSKKERSILAMDQKQGERIEESNMTVAERYLDPYNQHSVTGAMIASMPMNTVQMTSIASNPVNVITQNISSMFTSFSPKAKAATDYDYGVEKYGFSVSERESDLFEDPTFNAGRQNDDGVTLEQDLPRLNEKYGKCFGMTVTADNPDGKVHIQSADKSVNVFEISKDDYKDFPDCKPKTLETSSIQNDSMTEDRIYTAQASATAVELDRYNQYRFYLADAVNAVAMNCNEGDETSCSELGAASGGGDDSTTTSGEGAEKIVSVLQAEFKKNGNKKLETCGSNCGPEVQKYTQGPSGPTAPWCAWFVSWVYREAGYEFKGSPAVKGNIPSVANLVTWFKANGIHFTPDSKEYKPQPGDVIMYGGGEHTGIVSEVDGDNIKTIEGNTSADGNFNANGGTVGQKSFNYKTYTSRSIEFGRLKEF